MTACLLVALLALAPLAYASPPDPTWIGGFYDSGDYDDAVIAVCAMDAPPKLAMLIIPKSLEVTVDAVPPAMPAVLSRAPLSVPVVRAPPTT